jgi:hypothetical protein
LRQEWVPYAASYTSLAFDLLIVPFLFWRRTRLAAFCVAVVFHFLNAQLFPIDIFPWLAIAGTTLFLSPSWPRRALSFFRIKTKPPKIDTVSLPSAAKRTLVLSFVTIYVAIQILVPLRHFLYRGGIEWTYMEHRFSWQMMLERHTSRTSFYVSDPNTGQEFQIRSRQFLDLEQSTHMGWRPDMVRQFAHFLANKFAVAGPKPTEVRVRMYVSLNGRRPQLFLDPNVNLAAQPPVWGRPSWLLKVDEPLPPPGQDFSQGFF